MKPPMAFACVFLLSGCASIGPMPDWAYAPHPYSEDRSPQQIRVSNSRHQANNSTQSGRASGGFRGDRLNDLVMDGTVTDTHPGDRVCRDRYTGQIVGTGSTSPSGTTTYRDRDGRIRGSSAESSSGTHTYRDSRGSITGTSGTIQGTGGDSTTTYRNRDGQIVGNKYVSPAGNVTWRDGSGRIIDGPSQMKP